LETPHPGVEEENEEILQKTVLAPVFPYYPAEKQCKPSKVNPSKIGGIERVELEKFAAPS